MHAHCEPIEILDIGLRPFGHNVCEMDRAAARALFQLIHSTSPRFFSNMWDRTDEQDCQGRIEHLLCAKLIHHLFANRLHLEGATDTVVAFSAASHAIIQCASGGFRARGDVEDEENEPPTAVLGENDGEEDC